MCVRSYARKCQYFHRMAGSSPKSLNDDVSLEEVQELVRTREVDVKETDCDGNNILHKVCSLNTEKSDIVEYLISVGAAVNQVNSEGCTALIVCAGKGCLDTLKVLLKHGACVNPHGAVKQGHDSAVFVAAQNGHEKCVTELIRHGADISHRNESLLKVACKEGLVSVVKYCIDHGNVDLSHGQLRYTDKSALWYAAENGHVECLRLILNDTRYSKMDDSTTGRYTEKNNIVLRAATMKHEECVLELVAHYAYFSTQNLGENLFTVAVSNGLVKVVKECLKALDKEEIEQCTTEGETLVMLACKHKQYHCLQELVKSGKCHPDMINKVSKSGFTALMLCAQNGFIEGLKLLIQQKAQVDTAVSVFDRYSEKEKNKDENSALLLAVKSKNEESVKILIDHGADIWYKNNKGQNLLMLACAQGMLDTVQYCLSKGSFTEITDCDSEGNSALYHAYRGSHKECIKILLARGEITADVLMVCETRCRRNLLHVVCSERVERPDIVEILVSHSSLIDSEDSRGYTPLMLCAQKGYLETLKVLVKHGASLDIVHCSGSENPLFKIGKDLPARNTALFFAAQEKHEECVLELLNNGADIWFENNHGQSLVVLASASGLTAVVKKCFSVERSTEAKAKKSVSLRNKIKALHEAIKHNHSDCALVIMDHGADIWSSDDSLLKLASSKGMTEVVKRYLQNTMSTEELNRALQAAVMHRQETCALEIMGTDDADISFTTKEGRNILMLAAENGLAKFVKICCSMASSENINKKDNGKDSALSLAVTNGHEDVVEVLLNHGANPDITEGGDNAMINYLRFAACKDTKGEICVSELISHGAAFEQINRLHGETLLMIAAGRGWQRIVTVCLEKGSEAYVNATDYEGKDAMGHACENHRTACLEELLKNPKSKPMTKSLVHMSRYYSDGQELLEKYCPQMSNNPVGRTKPVEAENKREKELLSAAKRGHHNRTEVLNLLSSETDIWYTGQDGQNLLMVAAYEGMNQVVRHCIAKATFEKIHATDYKGKTAVIYACENSYRTMSLECLKEILKSEEAFKKQKHSKYSNLDAQIYGSNRSLMQIVCNSHEDRADIVQLLIKKGASVNEFDAEGFTPLMVCARKNHVKSLRILLQNGARVKDISRLGTWVGSRRRSEALALQGNTALHLAAMEGHESCVQQFISHGTDIWSCNSRGENLLMLASAQGLWKVVKFCLGEGSAEQVTWQDKEGNNALFHACKHSQTNSVSLLLQNVHCLKQINVFSRKLNMTPLMVATNYRCLEIVKLLLNMGANPNHENQIAVTCLLMAVGKNPRDHKKEPSPGKGYFRENEDFLEFVEPLLEKGANVNHVCYRTGETALTIAVSNRAHVSIVEKLVEYGASVNHVDKKGNTALLSSCENGQEAVIKLLLKNGASVVDTWKLTGKSVLTVAVGNGVDISTVQTLLKSGAYVNHTDLNGNTALLSACKNGQEDVAKLLLQHGADVNQVFKSTGDSALTFATKTMSSIDLVEELLKSGAYINHVNDSNNTALYNACRNTQQDIVKLLLDRGATASHVCKQTGNSALLVAISDMFSVGIIEQLVKSDSNINHADKSNNTALKIACRNCQGQVVKMLLKWGASFAENPMSSIYIFNRAESTLIRKLLDIGGLKIDKEQNLEKSEVGVVAQLYDMCRIPARQHVMNSFPNSNLFHTIPRLVLPQKMKDFLLYNYNINNSDDDQIPDLNITDGKYKSTLMDCS